MCFSNPSVTYAPGLSVDVPKRGQGHPLKSFSVPGPPSSSQLIANPNKHNGEFWIYINNNFVFNTLE